MTNAKRRRLAKAARKIAGNNVHKPTAENLAKLMRRLGTTRYMRRHPLPSSDGERLVDRSSYYPETRGH